MSAFLDHHRRAMSVQRERESQMRSVFYETQIVFVKCSIFCIHLIDSANPVLTIFSVTFPSRLTTDHDPIILGKWERAKSEKSEACQENLCGTSGEDFKPVVRKKMVFSKNYLFHTQVNVSRRASECCSRVWIGDSRYSRSYSPTSRGSQHCSVSLNFAAVKWFFSKLVSFQIFQCDRWGRVAEDQY